MSGNCSSEEERIDENDRKNFTYIKMCESNYVTTITVTMITNALLINLKSVR